MVEVALYSKEVESRTTLLHLVTKDKAKASSSSNYIPQKLGSGLKTSYKLEANLAPIACSITIDQIYIQNGLSILLGVTNSLTKRLFVEKYKDAERCKLVHRPSFCSSFSLSKHSPTPIRCRPLSPPLLLLVETTLEASNLCFKFSFSIHIREGSVYLHSFEGNVSTSWILICE